MPEVSPERWETGANYGYRRFKLSPNDIYTVEVWRVVSVSDAMSKRETHTWKIRDAFFQQRTNSEEKNAANDTHRDGPVHPISIPLKAGESVFDGF